MREIAVFSGSAHPELAAEICAKLGVPLQPVVTRRFANDCLEVQLQSNCRERDVFLIQPLGPPVQEHLVELLLMLDAARGASAARVTAVIPHYAYARSDKKNMPRVSIGGRLVADLLVTAGASRVLTMTLHSPQVHGFFSVPVDHLHALRELAGHFRGLDLSGTVGGVAGPGQRQADRDAGPAARRADRAGRQGTAERRAGHDQLDHRRGGRPGHHHPGRRDRPRDHRSSSCSTGWPSAAPASCGWPARTALFCDGALERIAARPEVAEIVCTNTVPMPGDGKEPEADT